MTKMFIGFHVQYP